MEQPLLEIHDQERKEIHLGRRRLGEPLDDGSRQSNGRLLRSHVFDRRLCSNFQLTHPATSGTRTCNSPLPKNSSRNIPAIRQQAATSPIQRHELFKPLSECGSTRRARGSLNDLHSLRRTGPPQSFPYQRPPALLVRGRLKEHRRPYPWRQQVPPVGNPSSPSKVTILRRSDAASCTALDSSIYSETATVSL